LEFSVAASVGGVVGDGFELSLPTAPVVVLPVGFTQVSYPVRQPSGSQQPDIDTRTRNAIQRSLRCPGERGFALLTGRWRTQHITASPSEIGDITRAALVLTHFEHAYIT
jgi:hypothetical protein